uniref:Fad7 n=1 Tax=Arundo donax TaxID=35708 RepID=A0A0A9ESZ0_ARUDO
MASQDAVDVTMSFFSLGWKRSLLGLKCDPVFPGLLANKYNGNASKGNGMVNLNFRVIKSRLLNSLSGSGCQDSSFSTWPWF